MVSIRKTTGAVLAGLVLAVSLSQAAAPTSVLAYAPASQGQQDVAAQQGPVSLTRTDEAYDGTSVPMVSLLEERQFQASVPVGGKSLDELAELVSEGKVGWSLTRTQGQFGTDAYPNQFMGGPLSDWKTVATENGPAESGNGLGEEGSGTLPSRDLFYDVSVEAKEVDGVPSIVLGFKNHLLYEGIDGIDVRARESVRSSLYDYVGTYRLACAIDGGEVGSTDLQLRPYDEFSTQEEIDAELPELAQQAIDNGLYAEVRQFGTTVDGRAMRALFVAKEKADLDRYQELKGRMESDPASVQAELASGSLDYKVPVVYSNVHADEIVAPDSVMAFARDLVRNQPLGYRRAASLTDEGKSELATEMDHDRTVWSDLIKDDVTGIGYLRGNGGSGRGTNYDGPDTDTASSDLSEDELSRYYNVEDKTFVPSVALDDMFFILVPSENVDARTDNVRTNANGFDLNRDNTYQTQPETQAMSGLIAQWDPLSLHEVHGYYQQYQVEPCSPTHDPNNEYDLFVDTALAQGEAFMASSIASNETINSVQMPMRDYLKLQGDGTRFWEMPFDDMSTSYTPQYAMMHGTNAYTVEAPYGTSDAVRALEYGFIGNADFVAQNKDRMFNNQLERFRRGVENIDADTVRPYYVNQADEAGAEADVFRPRDNENHNFFPEYYVIPLDPSLQKNRAAACESIDFLIHNGVRVEQTSSEVTVGGVTYPAGTAVVDMHQAKRNMANCALYPNLVISDWTMGSLYSEPVTNFSEFRGYDMDTVRTPGAFGEAGLSQVDEAPHQKSVTEGEGSLAVIKNNGLDAVRATNRLLSEGRGVGLISEGDDAGSYLVSSADYDSVKDDFVLDARATDAAPAAKSIDGDIKVYVPKAFDPYVVDAEGNEVGMRDYENRLNTNGNWDRFALEDQLGFTVTDDLGKADVIVGSQSPINADAVAAKVESGTPYVAYTADALQFVQDYGLADGLDFVPGDGDWWGFDALDSVEFPEDDLVTATYKNSGDTLMYGFGGGYITDVPDGAKVLVKTTDAEPVEGFMTREYLERYKNQVQAIDYEKDGKSIALFANTLTNKAHQQDDYRYLSAAIYSKRLGGDFVASPSPLSNPALVVVAVLVVAGAAYFVYRRRGGAVNDER